LKDCYDSGKVTERKVEMKRMEMNNKSLKTIRLLRLKTKIKIFLAVFSLLTVSVPLYTSVIKENFDNSFFMIDIDKDSNCALAEFESPNEGTVQNNPPETPVKPSGPTFIEAGVQYTYCAFTHNPDDELIRCRFDWGDGTISNWTQWETSNIPVSMPHVWTAISTFNIKVIAQDEKGLNSSWSTTLIVTVSQAEPRELPSFVNKSISNFEKFIWNSNGNYWEATGINIQVAIDDLGEIGGTVWLPFGKIIINNRINLVNNLSIIGHGRFTEIKLGNDANDDIFRIGSRKNILVNNISFNGNNFTQTIGWGGSPGTSNAIKLSGKTENVTIRNCFFENTVCPAIYAGHNTSFITVDSCYFNGRQNEGWGGAILFSGSDSIARNNFIKDTYDCGIVLEGSPTPATRCIIEGNKITGNIGHGIHMEYKRSNNCTIINNSIYNINSTAYIQTESHYSKGIILANNSICSKNVIRNIQYCGIAGYGNCVITDNIVTNIDGKGISCGSNSVSSNVTLFRNILSNTSIGIYIDKNGFAEIIENKIGNVTGFCGIYCKSDCLITNNEIFKTLGRGIYAGGGGEIIHSEIIRNKLFNIGNHSIIAEFYSNISGNYIGQL